jgi:hypothetical protein
MGGSRTAHTPTRIDWNVSGEGWEDHRRRIPKTTVGPLGATTVKN